MTSSVLLLAISLFVVGGANAASVPSNWKTCKRNLSPEEYDPCIKDAVKSAIDDLMSKGQPSLGIPPMNPLKITALDIGKGTGPVAVDLNFSDMELGGLESMEITNIRHKDAENFKLGADIVLKKPLTIKSKYSLDGKVLVLPIKGKGNCDLSMDNMKASLDLVGEGLQKGDETYMNVTGINTNFDTDRLHLHFENLFDGNKELGDNMNVFLNENWSDILRELKPAITEAFSLAFTAISNQIFHNIPYSNLVPPS